MKSILSFIIGVMALTPVNAQLVAKVEIKEHITGICNEKEVYALFPMFGDQKEAVCPVSNEEILRRLDSAVIFLKDNPKFSDKGIVNIMINCKGEVIKCDHGRPWHRRFSEPARRFRSRLQQSTRESRGRPDDESQL